MSNGAGGNAEKGPGAVDVDVLIVGAGPVGLTTANLLGMYGVRTRIVDSRAELIDYPRGVGLDDESLRTFQAAGVVDAVLPHTVPNQIMRFVNGKGRLLAEIDPRETPYGWPRRNGFVQPLVDAELLSALGRFDHVEVGWEQSFMSYTEHGDRVEAVLRASDGTLGSVAARYLVGCDGGRSATRRAMDVTFDGTTSATRWLVVDIENDPLGSPNIYVGADPKRPYVSVSIAHGIRRFEFMVKANESDETAQDDRFVAELLRSFVADPEKLAIIRRRVYTHHSRIAGSFMRGRVALAGDAAHLMPVWQGQGYNSGIRDAMNLSWKLAAVIKGTARPGLLDSYDVERRTHVTAMVKLSTTVGRVISPTSRVVAGIRDQLLIGMARVPRLKRYIVEMRYKPMPRMARGAVLHDSDVPAAASPVGQLLIQPRVDTRLAQDLALDTVLGNGFAVACWNNSPATVLDADSFARWRDIGAKFVALRPSTQLHWSGDDHPDVEVVGDRDGAIKRFFDQRSESVLFIRPDRIVAAACVAEKASTTAELLADKLCMNVGGDRDVSSVLHVAQSTAGADRPSGRG